MKRIYFFVPLLFLNFHLSAQLPSPDAFLGYELGTQYTPHHKIADYFYKANALMPQVMRLEKYGETNEGKDLLLATISSPENVSRLEEIRMNNLRLTGLLNDKPADMNAPVIVWLSYNVHGNEPSSSEVAMKTLYELLHPSDVQIAEWLKNTVVIIDPCLNPDGRDRYVNWITQTLGKYADANPYSREHSEPWPGGRTNHYNFDLNRDWAWQTQIETQKRVKKYNEWMPHIHCDFHEQYPENPYYFAPAAEPFHEVITPWQRNFQTTIGKNHAKYFDARGWLYFTREIFDLFYPAYGDTYPTYNGAIGMTYEQAGHSAGGLSIALSNGDTLTLKDRIAHHFTTSMSTIEIASKNAVSVVKEFKKYFDDAGTTGTGEYQTFIVTDTNVGKRKTLQQFFDANGIRYGKISSPSLKGYNYFSGKEEVFAANNSLSINVQQPKSSFIKVLFEPQSKLSDSVTYDITAWSLPYVYGVQAYAVKEKIPAVNYYAQKNKASATANAYGYVFPYSSFADVKFLISMLNAKIKVRFAEKDFSYNGKKFQKGALIVLRKGNEDKLQHLLTMITTYDAPVTEVSSGFMETGFDFGSERIHFLKKPSVALLTGNSINAGAAGEVWHLFDQQLNYPISLLNAEEADGSTLKNIDVLILPDGNYRFLRDKESAAGIKMWVQQGGKLIAIDNAASQIAKLDWGIRLKKDDEEDKKDEKDTKNSYDNLKRYENRERDNITNYIPGAIYKIEMDNSHPLAFGYNNQYFSLKQNDHIYTFLKEGWNIGVIKREQQVSGFVGSKTREKIKDGTVIGVQPMGSGSVVFFADDPIFRSFWENGKMLLTNAVFLVGQ